MRRTNNRFGDMRRARRPRTVAVEHLETRRLLTNDATIARFVGQIAAAGGTDTISISVGKENFTLSKDVILGFEVSATGSGTLDPAPVVLRSQS